MNIFKQFAFSMFRFDKYKELSRIGFVKVFLYEIVIFLVSVVFMMAPVAYFFISHGGMENILREYVPEFEIYDGALYTDYKINYELDDVIIIVNTDDLFGENEMYMYSKAILIDWEKIIVFNGFKTDYIYFEDIGDFDKEDILRLTPIFNLYAMLVLFILFFILIFYEAIAIGILSSVALLFNVIVKGKARYLELLKITVYSRTIAVVLKWIFSIFGVAMPFVFSLLVMCAYLFFGVRSLRDDENTL